MGIRLLTQVEEAGNTLPSHPLRPFISMEKRVQEKVQSTKDPPATVYRIRRLSKREDLYFFNSPIPQLLLSN